ncbi:hypothetical protein RCL1_006358 [Eukaryota sp. TZLM3-RCL]
MNFWTVIVLLLAILFHFNVAEQIFWKNCLDGSLSDSSMFIPERFPTTEDSIVFPSCTATLSILIDENLQISSLSASTALDFHGFGRLEVNHVDVSVLVSSSFLKVYHHFLADTLFVDKNGGFHFNGTNFDLQSELSVAGSAELTSDITVPRITLDGDSAVLSFNSFLNINKLNTNSGTIRSFSDSLVSLNCSCASITGFLTVENVFLQTMQLSVVAGIVELFSSELLLSSGFFQLIHSKLYFHLTSSSIISLSTLLIERSEVHLQPETCLNIIDSHVMLQDSLVEIEGSPTIDISGNTTITINSTVIETSFCEFVIDGKYLFVEFFETDFLVRNSSRLTIASLQHWSTLSMTVEDSFVSISDSDIVVLSLMLNADSSFQFLNRAESFIRFFSAVDGFFSYDGRIIVEQFLLRATTLLPITTQNSQIITKVLRILPSNDCKNTVGGVVVVLESLEYVHQYCHSEVFMRNIHVQEGAVVDINFFIITCLKMPILLQNHVDSNFYIGKRQKNYSH